jgi:hypothetical protein
VRRSRLAIGVVVGLLAFSACGDDDDDSGADPGAGTTTTEAAAAEPTTTIADDSAGSAGGGAEKYADDLCTALSDWSSDIQDESAGLDDDIESLTDLAAVKSVFVDFLDQTVNRTEAMVAEVGNIDIPDDDDFEAFSADLNQGLVGLVDIFATARDEAAALSLDDPAAFAASAEDIGVAVAEATEVLGTELETLEDDHPEVAERLDAFDCAGLE